MEGMKVIHKESGEKFLVVRHNSIKGFLRGGTVIISNLKTKKMKEIVGNDFKKNYEILC